MRPAYGVAASAALGVIVALTIGIAVLRTLDSPANAQSRGSAGAAAPTVSGRPSTPRPAPSRTPAEQSTVGQSPAAVPSETPSSVRSTVAPPTESAATQSELRAWLRTLRELDAQRAYALKTLDPEILDRVYVPKSPPWTADRALLDGYREDRVHVENLRITIEKVAVKRRTPTTVTLEAVDRLDNGHLVDATGAKTALPPGRPVTRLITLSADAPTWSSPVTNTPGWRITSITLP